MFSRNASQRVPMATHMDQLSSTGETDRDGLHTKSKGTLLGTPNREPQEYSRYIIGIYLPGSLYSIIFLLYSWGSLSGVPSRVPLKRSSDVIQGFHKALSAILKNRAPILV